MTRPTAECRDFGDPDVPLCREMVDERYTLCFDDIGELPIRWCAHCGPIAHKLHAALLRAFSTRGLDFIEEFAGAIMIAELPPEQQEPS